LRSGQRAAAVVTDGRLAGIITLSDLARSQASSPDAPVSTLMTPVEKIKGVSPASDSMQALGLLAQSGYHQLPIIDETGAVVGFITREGLLQRLAQAH
jgi:CBS domain-containing protein